MKSEMWSKMKICAYLLPWLLLHCQAATARGWTRPSDSSGTKFCEGLTARRGWFTDVYSSHWCRSLCDSYGRFTPTPTKMPKFCQMSGFQNLQGPRASEYSDFSTHVAGFLSIYSSGLGRILEIPWFDPAKLDESWGHVQHYRGCRNAGCRNAELWSCQTWRWGMKISCDVMITQDECQSHIVLGLTGEEFLYGKSSWILKCITFLGYIPQLHRWACHCRSPGAVPVKPPFPGSEVMCSWAVALWMAPECEATHLCISWAGRGSLSCIF